MRRVSVVGTSGAGKSTFARRLAEELEVPYVEIDAIFHQPGWTTLPPDEFVARIREATDGDGWVVDGNYRLATREGPVWERADTVVWLDPPDGRLMRQIVGRTMRRWATREELWNGNREPFTAPFRLDPNRSMIRWAWTNRNRYRNQFGEASTDATWSHLTFHRLTTIASVDDFLAAAVDDVGDGEGAR